MASKMGIRLKSIFGKPRSFSRIWIICALIYAYFVGGYFSNTMTNSMATLSVALVEEQTLIIDDFAQHERDIARYNGHLYSGMPPGLSAFLLPIYIGLKAPLLLVPEKWLNKLDNTITGGLQEKHEFFHASKKRSAILLLLVFGVFFVAIPMTLLLGIRFVDLCQRIFPTPLAQDSRFLISIVFFLMLGTGIADFTATLFHTTVATTLVWIAYVDFIMNFGKTRTPRELLLLGLALGTVPTLDYPAVIYPGVLAPILLWAQPRKERLRSLGWLFVGAAFPVGLAAIYHTLAFDRPWTTAYQMRIVKLDRHFKDIEAASAGLTGVQAYLVRLWHILPDWERIKRIFIDPICNLPIFNPLLPLGLIAAAFQWFQAFRTQNHKMKFVWGGAFFILFVNISYYASIPITLNPAGGSYGARYTIYSVPFGLLALLPALKWFSEKAGKTALTALLCTISIPAWFYLFYGSPNRPWNTYWEFLTRIGPTNYTLFKAYEAGWIKNPFFISYGCFFLLLAVCYGIWAIRFDTD